MWKNRRDNCCRTTVIGTVGALAVLGLIVSCSPYKEIRTSREYYETGEIRQEQTWTAYEYEFREFYKDGKRKKVVYGTQGNLLIREFYPDGKLKRETKSVPNQEFEKNMNLLREN